MKTTTVSLGHAPTEIAIDLESIRIARAKKSPDVPLTVNWNEKLLAYC